MFYQMTSSNSHLQKNFNQPLKNGVLPKNLKYLSLGKLFNKPINVPNQCYITYHN